MSEHRAGSEDDIEALVEYVVDLGGTPEEIQRAARVAGLGPLALELALRPEGQSVPFETFLHDTPLDPGQVRRLWSALGLPESPPMPFPVTSDMAEALRALSFLTEHLGEEAVLGLARVIGSSVARLADALSSATRVGVEVPQIDTGMPYSEVARSYTAVARGRRPSCGTPSAQSSDGTSSWCRTSGGRPTRNESRSSSNASSGSLISSAAPTC